MSDLDIIATSRRDGCLGIHGVKRMIDASMFEDIKQWINERGEQFRAEWTGSGYKMFHLEGGAWVHHGAMTASKNASITTLNNKWEAES